MSWTAGNPGRYGVLLDNGAGISVKEENLQLDLTSSASEKEEVHC